MMKMQAGHDGPDQYGRLWLEGSPEDLLEGDIVLDGQYAVLDTKAAKHNGEDAIQLTLCDPGEYAFEVPRDGIPPEKGRDTLVRGAAVRFIRETDDLDFGEENEVFYELEFCEHDEHDEYSQRWDGLCKDLPVGTILGINTGGSDAVQPACKIVDSVYGNGTVLFTDGSAFQSHPDRRWTGFRRQLMSTSYEH